MTGQCNTGQCNSVTPRTLCNLYKSPHLKTPSLFSQKGKTFQRTPATLLLLPSSAVKPHQQDCECGAEMSTMDAQLVCIAGLRVQHAQAALDSPGSREHCRRFTLSLFCRPCSSSHSPIWSWPNRGLTWVIPPSLRDWMNA